MEVSLTTLCFLPKKPYLVVHCSNDAFDAGTGVDTPTSKPESIVNLLGGNWQGVLLASFACLIGGVSILMRHVTASGSPIPGYLLLAAIVCGYVYQGPPFRCASVCGKPLSCVPGSVYEGCAL